MRRDCGGRRSRSTCDVEPGDVRLVAGRPLTVRARVESNGEAIGRAQPQLIVTAGGDTRTVPMDASGDGYRFDFASVDRSFQLSRRRRRRGVERLRGDRAVRAADRAHRARVPVSRRSRDWSRAPTTTAATSSARPARQVRLRIHTDKPVTAGELMMAGTGPDVRAAGSQVLEADLVIARDDSYRVRLHDADGLSSTGDSEVLHPRHGGPAARCADPQAVGRSEHHAAAGSRHRSARRGRLRCRCVRAGLRGRRRSGHRRALCRRGRRRNAEARRAPPCRGRSARAARRRDHVLRARA